MGADTIKQGPPSAKDCIGSEGLIVDAVNGNLYVFGTAGKPSAVQTQITTILAPTAITNITTAQTLLTQAFNAGALNVLGRTMDLSLFALYSSPGTTTPTLTFTLALGGVTLASFTTGAVSATASTNLAIRLTALVTVMSTGTAGTLEAHGSLSANLSANQPGAAQSVVNDAVTGPSAAINLTLPLNLTLTVSATSNISSVQLRTGYIQLTA